MHSLVQRNLQCTRPVSAHVHRAADFVSLVTVVVAKAQSFTTISRFMKHSFLLPGWHSFAFANTKQLPLLRNCWVAGSDEGEFKYFTFGICPRWLALLESSATLRHFGSAVSPVVDLRGATSTMRGRMVVKSGTRGMVDEL